MNVMSPALNLCRLPKQFQNSISPLSMTRSRTSSWTCVVEHSSHDSTNVSRSTSMLDRKSTRLNSSHVNISYAVFFLKKKKRVRCGGIVSQPRKQHGAELIFARPDGELEARARPCHVPLFVFFF